jgi:tripartite-type tricarboxylate transporter receptor subunit TctC
MEFKGTMLRLAGIAALAGIVASPATAAEDFYKGKQITIICSADAGTGYDAYARLMSEFLPRHIPGNPQVVVQNMPGASGLKAANFVYNVAAKDGLTIAATHAAIPTAPLFSPDAAQYDVKKIPFIGNVTGDPYVGLVWHTAPIKTLEEAKTTEVIMGGGAVGSASVDMAIFGREMFGLKFKIVTGYKSSAETKLAIEREEIHGTFGNGWTSLKTGAPDWLKENKIRIITQFGFKKHPELPDVPLFMDLAQKPEERQIVELLLARQEFAKPYYFPPGTPADRVDTLRRAFDKVIKDPGFVAAAEKGQLALDGPMTGEELGALASKLADTPRSLLDRIDATFAKFREGNK